jgi:23S rRNA (adenine2503-C2)-methyltransferase
MNAPTPDRRPVTGHTPDSLRNALVALGEKPFRASQILRHLYRRCATSYEEMTDLPAALRARLAKELPLLSTGEPEEKRSKDGTSKLLVPCADGQPVECVMIPEPPGKGCVFCASGLSGLARNLTAAEIVEQVIRQGTLVRERAGGIDHPINNVVFMGMGEPFYNLDAVLGAIEVLNADWGMGIGLNRMTVSTVGVQGGVGRLAAHRLAPNLALSLHAPDDAIRARVVPFPKALTVNELIAEGVQYRAKTGKEVTCEYVMLEGINAGAAEGRELARRLGGKGLKVNLIPYNAVEGLEYGTPSARAVKEFSEILERAGVAAPVRRSRGDRIAAACGQLRLQRVAPGAGPSASR